MSSQALWLSPRLHRRCPGHETEAQDNKDGRATHLGAGCASQESCGTSQVGYFAVRKQENLESCVFALDGESGVARGDALVRIDNGTF